MDVVKTRQQGFFHEATLHKGESVQSLQHINWRQTSKVIYKERGVLGFWDGLVVPFVCHLRVVRQFDSRHVWCRSVLLLASRVFAGRNQRKTVGVTHFAERQQHQSQVPVFPRRGFLRSVDLLLHYAPRDPCEDEVHTLLPLDC